MIPDCRDDTQHALHHQIGSIQVNLVTTSCRSDVYRIGAEKVETSSGTIARLPLGFVCDRTARQYHLREVAERMFPVVRLVELP